MEDNTMRPKQQVPRGTTDVTKFVSITPMTDEVDGDQYMILRRYKGKEKEGEAILSDCRIPERAQALVEEFRNL